MAVFGFANTPGSVFVEFARMVFWRQLRALGRQGLKVMVAVLYKRPSISHMRYGLIAKGICTSSTCKIMLFAK